MMNLQHAKNLHKIVENAEFPPMIITARIYYHRSVEMSKERKLK